MNLIKMDQKTGAMMERVVAAGDLVKLNPEDRVKYYFAVCESVGLNPLTKPFDLITMNGKMVMYATRTATDQLRAIQKVSIKVIAREKQEDVYTVVAQASTPDGRSDESTGVVSIGGLRGDVLANAIMKAETKAKRRVTLSIVGLGWLDESETETIRGAKTHRMDLNTGEVHEASGVLDKPNQINGEAINMNSTALNDGNERMNLLKQITQLITELGITQDNMRQELSELKLPSSLKVMTCDQLTIVLKALLDEKMIRQAEFKATPVSREPGDDSWDEPPLGSTL